MRLTLLLVACQEFKFQPIYIVCIQPKLPFYQQYHLRYFDAQINTIYSGRFEDAPQQRAAKRKSTKRWLRIETSALLSLAMTSSYAQTNKIHPVQTNLSLKFRSRRSRDRKDKSGMRAEHSPPSRQVFNPGSPSFLTGRASSHVTTRYLNHTIDSRTGPLVRALKRNLVPQFTESGISVFGCNVVE